MKAFGPKLSLLFFLSLATLTTAQESSNPKSIKEVNRDLTKLKEELNGLKNDYQAKIEELSEKISQLEKTKAAEEEKTELEKLLNSARDFAKREKEEEVTIARVFRGGQRQLQALNPNISMTGDFYGSISNVSSIHHEHEDENNHVHAHGIVERNRFALREAEFHIIAPLDPFTRGKFFLGVPGDGNLHVCEAYMEWLNLPARMNLKIGKFNTQFGILNRWHDHGLPQIDRPRALINLFAGSLNGVGVSANFLLPKLWAHVNELDLEVVTGGDGVSFDTAYDNVIIVSHLKNYYDLTRNTYLEIGLSGAHGCNDKENDYRTFLAALDMTYKWVPAGRSHYRTVEFRNEFFYSHREAPTENINRIGFYSYISNRMGASFWTGVRYGYSELPREIEKDYEWDISPYIDFWQSEFVMMRLQYSYTYRNYAENDHSVFLQSVWSMGPHKHEAY
ncbi:hypothetical protein ISS37_10695 [candidate division KSB1 bacterium]|nr:hypothetical protein [candidate division KSB1 bacterium]